MLVLGTGYTAAVLLDDDEMRDNIARRLTWTRVLSPSWRWFYERVIHQPSRLAILSALLACAEADFQYLLSVTGLTKGNLSSHLSKLEAGGLVAVEKGYEGKIGWTRARLTAAAAPGSRRTGATSSASRQGEALALTRCAAAAYPR